MAILSSKQRRAMQICLFLVYRPGYIKMKEEHVYWSGNYLPLKHVLFLKSAFKKSDAILNIIEMIILKDDALKLLHSICQQIWKTHQWPQDWKRSVSFQSQRKAIPKNAQTTAQLHSSHILAKKCLKFSKLGFNST